MSLRGAYQIGSAKGLKLDSLGNRIKAIRLRWGWSQIELAKALGVPQQSISSWEGGKTEPLGPSMAGLCRLTGMTEGDLRAEGGFQIPEAPDASPILLHVTEPIPNGRDIRLPSVSSSGFVCCADIGTGGIREIPVEEAIQVLKRLVKEGKDVWLVAKEE